MGAISRIWRDTALPTEGLGYWLALGLTGLAVFALPFSNSVFAPGAILAIWGLGLLAVHRGAIWSEPWIRWMLVLMAALWLPQLFALTGAVNLERALRTAVGYPLYAIAMVPLLWACRIRDLATPLLYLTFGLTVLWSLDGLLQFIAGTNILGFPYNGRRVTGLSYPDLRLGVILAHLLPFVLEATRRLMAKTRLAALLPLLPVLTIILSGSRAAMLMMVIALGVYGLFLIWFYRPRKLTVGALAAALVLAMGTLLWASPETRDRITAVAQIVEMDVDSVDAATARRGQIWVAAWQVATDHPVRGVGVRGVEPAANDRGYISREFVHTHLYWLDVFVSTGAVGLIAYLLTLTGILGALWIRARQYAVNAPMFMAGGLAIFGAMNPINSHWTIYSSYTAALSYLVIALALSQIIRLRQISAAGCAPQSTPDTPPASGPASPAV